MAAQEPVKEPAMAPEPEVVQARVPVQEQVGELVVVFLMTWVQ